MVIKKSQGKTLTEKFLSEICERTFLKLWCYPAPFKSDGKELCDLLAVFENHVFLFFDRESRKFDAIEKDTLVQWERWKKEAIEKQIITANGAKRYISQYPDQIYLDAKKVAPFPIKVPAENIYIHKIIVAHGAKEACESFSDDNVSGSLAVTYGNSAAPFSFPFMLQLEKNDPIHVFDSHNLDIIFNELDTFYDFVSYLTAKELAISQLDHLSYCGEEDLLAHYYSNFDGEKHYIGTKDKKINFVHIGEGEWQNFIKSAPYKRRKEANEISYVWDKIIQKTCQNALDGTLLGNGDIFNSQSAIYEMAKEPRFSRRALSEAIMNAIDTFPYSQEGRVRHLSFMPSFYADKAYVFLQIKDDAPSNPDNNYYDNEYRPKRQAMLKIACGVTKNKFSHLKKIIGIAIDAPKFVQTNSEDFILMNCEKWSDADKTEFEDANKGFQFYETKSLKVQKKRVLNFPRPALSTKKQKVGRNDKCGCGSGKKYKRCCGIN